MEILIVLAVIYFFPTIIAKVRTNNNTLAIFLVNLFLGWTIAGWFWCLIMACTGYTDKRDRQIARYHAEAARKEWER